MVARNLAPQARDVQRWRDSLILRCILMAKSAFYLKLLPYTATVRTATISSYKYNING